MATTSYIYKITNLINGKACRGKVNHVYGYKWRYVEGVETNF